MLKMKKRLALFIEGKRNGYSAEQCGRTMTVGELIEFLHQFDRDREVFIRNDGGYTFGSINEIDINPGYYDDDNEYLDEKKLLTFCKCCV